jgi:hypothetical protein
MFAGIFGGPKIEITSESHTIIDASQKSDSSVINPIIMGILSRAPFNQGRYAPERVEISIFGHKNNPFRITIDNPAGSPYILYYSDSPIEGYGKIIAIPNNWDKKDEFISEFKKQTGQTGGARRTRRKYRRGKSRRSRK